MRLSLQYCSTYSSAASPSGTLPLDAAAPDRKTTSKVIIDATRQWPEEGGPPFYQELNRTLFENAAPDALERVTAKWPDKLLAKRQF